MTTNRQPLAYYLGLEYPYTVVPDDGSFFIQFPDLPGCMTQVEDAADIALMAEEIRTLWIEGEYEDGHEIPEPVTTAHSGKFVVRLPKSLHRDLARDAEREGVSLNAYVTYLLAERRAAKAGTNDTSHPAAASRDLVEASSH
jgi:antitoxin HicB